MDVGFWGGGRLGGCGVECVWGGGEGGLLVFFGYYVDLRG
jgi:hypothetical protein